MKNKILSLFVLTVLVIGGAVLYERSVIQAIEGDVLLQTDTVATAYIDLAETTFLPLAERYDLTSNQQAIVRRTESAMDELQETAVLMEKLRLITAIQSAMKSFVGSLAAGQAFAEDPAFLLLQREVSDRSSLKTVLDDYNALAARWNNTLQNQVGRLSGRLEGKDHALLPYLNEDGRQEFVPIISL